MNNYIQQKLEEFDALYPTATWDKENGEHLIINPTLHRKHKELLMNFVEQALKDTAREVLDKTLKEDANLFCLLLHPHLPEKKYEELKRFFESQQDLRRLSFQDMVTKLNNL